MFLVVLALELSIIFSLFWCLSVSPATWSFSETLMFHGRLSLSLPLSSPSHSQLQLFCLTFLVSSALKNKRSPPPISQALFIIFTVLLKGGRMILEDWQQTVDHSSLYWDYEPERTTGVSHFHLMTVYLFM